MTTTIRYIFGGLLSLFLLVRLWQKRQNKRNLVPQSSRPTSKNVVSHITIATSDLEASLRFFVTLGLLEVSRKENESILLSLPALSARYNPMILLQKQEAKKQKKQSPTGSSTTITTGLVSLGLMVKDIDATLAILKKNDYKCDTLPVKEDRTDPDYRPMFSVTRAAVRDESSNIIIELTQYNTVSMKVFLSTMEFFGQISFPTLVHASLVTTVSYKKTTLPAYQALCSSFDTNMDFGGPSNPEKERNYHQNVLSAFSTKDVNHECMMKTFSDVFSLNIIEIGSTTDTDQKKIVKSPHGVAMVLSSDDDSKKKTTTPKGWSTGVTTTQSLPMPLGRAHTKTLVDPSGIPLQLIKYD